MKSAARNIRRCTAVTAIIAMFCLSAPGAMALEDQPEGRADNWVLAQSGADSEESAGSPDSEVSAQSLAEDEVVIPGSEYSLLEVSSEMDPYPGPGYVDGTGEAVFTDDMNDTWAVRYTVENSVGVAVDDFPHWIAFDTGASRELTGLQYAIKNQISGPATDYQVFISDAASAPEATADWGEPVAVGTLPTDTPQVHTIEFPEAVPGRWVRFEIHGSIHPGKVSGASLLRVIAIDSEEPTEPPVGPENPATAELLQLGDFRVNVGQEFPQIIDYSVPGAHMNGNAEKLSNFLINGQTVAANTTFNKDSDVKVSYRSTFTADEWANLVVSSSITLVDEGVVRFAIESIEGPEEGNVRSIGVPDHKLLQVDSSQPNATLSRTSIDTDTRRAADKHIAIKGATEVDAKAIGSPYAFLSADGAAGGLYTNSTLFSGVSDTNERILTQITSDGSGTKTASLASNSWVWSPMADGDNGVATIDSRVSRFELPETTIVVTGDRNQSGNTDWQDAAIVLRDQIEVPAGSQRVPERVAQRIPFNFGSEASNPFLKTLDNLKRVSQATDGLGQWLLLKGFGSEGHDSANTDYGGHYNERAGGLEDLNALVSEGHENWNSDFAVHVNTTEAYPQARAFSDLMADNPTQASGKGWGWLNQSYYINQFYDLGSGDVLDRFEQLRNETDIDSVYIDVYYSGGWRAEGLAKQLHEMGFEVATEWAHKFEGNSIWSHWANDKSYGGASDKGINSDMIRFMFNTQRDVWNIDPLLGGVNMLDFEGWGSKDNYPAYLKSLWTDNLPTKYLQHFPVTSWNPGASASLEGDIEITMEAGVRVVTQGGVEVLRGGPSDLTYLLPWGEENQEGISDPLNGNKMYYYSTTGGSHQFALTEALAVYPSFEQFKLTDNGREKVADVTSTQGKVNLASEPGVAYVLVPSGEPAPYPEAQFGQYTNIVDPGFNSGNLEAWNPLGNVTLGTLSTGDSVAVLGAEAASISQEVTGLEAGQTYQLSAMVEIGPRAERSFTMGAGAEETSFSVTPALNRVGSEPKHNTYMQRAFVTFVAPANGSVEISFKAGDGDAPVRIDDVRIQKREILTNKSPLDGETPLPSLVEEVPEGAQLWDFEDNQPGLGPFVRGGAGGLSDARTSISELHSPYSQAEWKNANWPHNGKGDAKLTGRGIDDVLSGTHSLKSYDDYSGLLYRTIPARVDFEKGHAYRVSFSYQATLSNEYSFVVGSDDLGSGTSTTISSTGLPATTETVRWNKEFVAGCQGIPFVGISRVSPSGSLAELTIDDFMVEDLGETDDAAACATLTPEATGDFTKGAANRLVTSFTNQEATPVTNVAMTLTDLPSGWVAETEDEDGNLFQSVGQGKTVSTTWLIHVPDDTKVEAASLGVTAEYAVNCSDRILMEQAHVSVSNETRLSIPKDAITPTTSMQNQSGESIENALVDNDSLWHSSWSGSVTLPATVEFTLDQPTIIDGWGYQQRPTGVNGRLKDYRIEVMLDGEWQTVSTGTWQAMTALQTSDFEPVTTTRVRMVIDSVYPGDASGNIYTSARRLVLYGVPNSQESGFVPGQRPETDVAACKDAPETSISIKGDLGLEGWFISAPVVTLESSETDSTTWYRIEPDSDYIQYTQPVTVPDGTWQMQYYSEPSTGPSETEKTSDWLKVDTEPPVVTAAFDAQNRTIHIDAIDETSGILGIEYSLDNGETWNAYTTSVAVEREAGTVGYRATDRAGNRSEEGSLDYPAGEVPTVRPQMTIDKTQIRPGDSVTVTIGGLLQWGEPTIEVGIASEYQKLVDLDVDTAGNAHGTVAIPLEIPAGVHTLLAKDASGETVASVAIEVVDTEPGGSLCPDGESSCPDGKPSGGGLAATGAAAVAPLLAALGMGLLGVVLLRSRRRRH